MPSPLAHTITGYLIYRYAKPTHSGNRARFLMIPLQLIIIADLSLLPDLDILPGLLLSDMARFHNSASHSLIVGLFVALVASVVISRIRKSDFRSWFAVALISYELHVIMDYFTGDRVVMLYGLLLPKGTAPR